MGDDECEAVEAAVKAGFIRIHVSYTDLRVFVQCRDYTAEKEKDFIRLIKKVTKMHGYRMVYEIDTETTMRFDCIKGTPLRSE